MCWYTYKGVNTTVNCLDNSVQFNYSLGDNNITLCANDTFGNTGCNFSEFSPIIIYNSESHNNQTFETKSELFSINITTDGSVPSSPEFIYEALMKEVEK